MERLLYLVISIICIVPNCHTSKVGPKEEGCMDNCLNHHERGRPEWTSKKQDHETIARPANSYVHLKCPAVGHPKPRIKWLFNGREFKGNAAGQWNMKGFKLTLGDLVPKDSGDYTCIVSNLYGSINWTYTLQVVQRIPHAPVIEGPKNQTVRVGEDVVFNCMVVLSDLPPQIQWLRHYKVNGSYTTPAGDPYVEVLQTSNGNTKKPGQLILHNASMAMAGWYTCNTQNSFEIEYVSAWLTVVDDGAATEKVITMCPGTNGPSSSFPPWAYVVVGVVGVCLLGCAAYGGKQCYDKKKNGGDYRHLKKQHEAA